MLTRVGLSAPVPGWQAPAAPTFSPHRRGLGCAFYSTWVVIPRYRLSVGTSEKIQLSSLIAAFQVTRDLIVAEA